ncbi:type I restriction modification DNA specificity domain protein [Rickettsia endosymbiont of Ixodes pacificus]|uniref:restriction endonuclease subunit S n=1 Tax=Rickettsia endosymbiont of Ixodes pacificus TaxID=1133329 RepID=UPI00061ED08F|nr:restriction endonuclease subunit S [Rickettsia endosymbiont of Ixodes pacificus]KJW02475.1 type I restriction modification DNA specificity domain protein [Rickettsia endosymbiont of Ixodes pacificus]
MVYLRRFGKWGKRLKLNNLITEKALEETSVKLLPTNTILLSCTATIGKVAFSKIPLTTNQQINWLVIKEEYADQILPKFLFYTCKSLEQKLLDICTTQTTKYISITKLDEIAIFLPPIEEQQKIVEELDSYQKIIDGAKQIIDNWKPSFEINKQWKIVKIGDICNNKVQYGLSQDMNIEGEG